MSQGQLGFRSADRPLTPQQIVAPEPNEAELTPQEILEGSIEENRPPLIVRLAEELVWKLEHPQQHASGADHALEDLLDAMPDEMPDDLRERIRRRL